MDVPMFADRREAGQALAAAVGRGVPGPVTVVGIARGGVPVAAEVADALGAPLDAMVVRKVGHPMQPELALGAVTSDGTFTPSGVDAPEVSGAEFDRLIARAVEGAARMEALLRGPAPARDLVSETCVLVDDGVATGASLRAAVRAARSRGAAAVVVATPVASPEAAECLAAEADEVVCARLSRDLLAVGQAYRDFSPVEVDEVVALLGAAARSVSTSDRPAGA